ncbi:unnamed protein product [Rotaria socialis]|uniref:Uncharacterized protein n=1 Tax=Rotaria socialis TaxID=392032 RepID=A0A821IBJ6_9BILA|nr:unnamed protein product [Rotaria socialis]
MVQVVKQIPLLQQGYYTKTTIVLFSRLLQHQKVLLNQLLLLQINSCRNLTFDESFSYEYSNYILFVAVGDFNDDNYMNLVVPCTQDLTMHIFLGYGNGSFQLPIISQIEELLGNTAGGDLNDDSHADIVVCNIIVSGPYAIAIADLNHDQILDLLVTNTVANIVSVLLGYGNGTFAPQNSLVTGIMPDSIVTADFNHDNHVDFVVANYVSQSVTVHLGIGNGTFLNRCSYITTDAPAALGTGDLNEGENMELIYLNCGNSLINVFLGYGNSTFCRAYTYMDFDCSASGVIGDFNGDNHLDVLISLFGSDHFSLMFSDGTGALGKPQLFNSHHQSLMLVLSDFNGDHGLDFVVSDSQTDVGVYLNECIRCSLGRKKIQTLEFSRHPDDLCVAFLINDSVKIK